METPRDRRLRLELERMRNLALENSDVTFRAVGPRPIEYEVSLHCTGVESIDNDQLLLREEHQFVIRVTEEFPLEAPALSWLTPLYHPNIAPPRVCLGDYWYPGWSLAKMCKVLTEMVRYKSFNVYDPLNKEAAHWVEQMIANRGSVLFRDYGDQTFEIVAVRRTA